MGAAIEVGMSAEVAHGDGRDLADELDRLEALGCDLAEIPLIALCVIAGGRILPGPTSRLVAACAGRPLAYSVHAAIGLNFMGEPEHLRLQFDVAVASFDVAARIGARHVVMHTGFCRADAPDIEDRYARQREWLARLGLEAQARDCTICVENIFPFEPDHHTASPSRLAREIAAIGHEHVRATLDVSHGFLHAGACGGDPLAEALALARVSRHVHLHDSFGRPGGDVLGLFAGGARRVRPGRSPPPARLGGDPLRRSDARGALRARDGVRDRAAVELPRGGGADAPSGARAGVGGFARRLRKATASFQPSINLVG
ncbi:sugar phosphate isomerase/epimerase family protein [Salinarimonas sp.]|uniref:sugar phosphate isomerase/epimerase family protein n=1 Tax=Salinarimonas sp. TaxID=2766526 RepID=UPI00391CDFF9